MEDDDLVHPKWNGWHRAGTAVLLGCPVLILLL